MENEEEQGDEGGLVEDMMDAGLLGLDLHTRGLSRLRLSEFVQI